LELLVHFSKGLNSQKKEKKKLFFSNLHQKRQKPCLFASTGGRAAGGVSPDFFRPRGRGAVGVARSRKNGRASWACRRKTRKTTWAGRGRAAITKKRRGRGEGRAAGKNAKMRTTSAPAQFLNDAKNGAAATQKDAGNAARENKFSSKKLTIFPFQVHLSDRGSAFSTGFSNGS
jgi:hypothetical protein